MPLMIRQGDTTSHGGTVLEGFPFYTVEGRAVAAMGHKVACPLCKGPLPGWPNSKCPTTRLAI
uniref:PAAR domain-containing protein n=1 Tax=Limnobacter sp. TaxID=2003368 RepID=UPI003FA59825